MIDSLCRGSLATHKPMENGSATIWCQVMSDHANGLAGNTSAMHGQNFASMFRADFQHTAKDELLLGNGWAPPGTRIEAYLADIASLFEITLPEPDFMSVLGYKFWV